MTRRLVMAIAVVALAPGGAAAARLASVDERRPIELAAAYLTSVGVPVEAPTVTVSDDPASCLRDAMPWACATPSGIVLSGEAARVQLAVGRRCGDSCRDALHGDLHELVHMARFRLSATLGPTWWEEGLADAVAVDQVCGLEHRLTGHLGRVDGVFACRRAPGYGDAAARVRWISAAATGRPWPSAVARRWRLDQVSRPVWWTVTAAPIGAVPASRGETP